MSENFDLTTRQGGQAAVKFLKGFDWTDAAAYIALGPLGILANQVRKQVMSSEDQAKVAKDLIKRAEAGEPYERGVLESMLQPLRHLHGTYCRRTAARDQTAQRDDNARPRIPRTVAP